MCLSCGRAQTEKVSKPGPGKKRLVGGVPELTPRHCNRCPFVEVLQAGEAPLTACPHCGGSLVEEGQAAQIIPRFAELLKRVTSKSLESGTYQRKVMARFATYNLPAAMQALYVGALNGSVPAATKTLETYGMLEKGGGVIVNNLTDNRQLSIERGERSLGPKSFEEMARSWKADREARQLGTGPVTVEDKFVETPEGAQKLEED